MGIFSHAQGQLTPQLVVGSGRISNSFEISCMSWLPASLKKEWMKNHCEKVETPSFPLYGYSVVCGPTGLKFELVQDIMHVLITFKFKKDWINNSYEKVETLIF